MIKCFFLSLAALVNVVALQGQIEYPAPLQFISLTIENKKVSMAFMDIKPATPNGKTIVLLHGKNFNGYYWKNVIPAFSEKGYRTIIPDQLGWGRSDKPDLHYSFHLLASNTKALLDSLGIGKAIILGHSMGGMLAIRFALLFPGNTEKLILENPIGLEDYKSFVPYRSLEELYKQEKSANYESYKKYQQSYYPEWKPEYEQYVKAQAEALKDPAFDKIAWVNAVTYQMIYEQPIAYELTRLTVSTLLIIGQADRTVVGKDQLTEEQKKKYGQYPELGRSTKQRIKNSRLVELPGVGHIPHVQDSQAFSNAVFTFLQ